MLLAFKTVTKSLIGCAISENFLVSLNKTPIELFGYCFSLFHFYFMSFGNMLT